MAVLGLDIGGANTKATLITTKNRKLQNVKTAVKYYPIWKNPEKLGQVLLSLAKQLNIDQLNAIGVTITAELSDAYSTKRQGINQILECVQKAFPNQRIYALNTEYKLLTIDDAKGNPLLVAAANWVATGWLVAQRISDCVIVDVGSTSTSIIPILNGQIAAKGKTDLDKLICGELLYTGALRTNVAAIVNHVPIKGCIASVSSELFAISADVHLILGNITEKQYICETADGRGKSVPDALARLSRIVCADTEMLTESEIIGLAKFEYNEQIKQVANSLEKVFENIGLQASGVTVVVTGLARDFIARAAAKAVGARAVIDLSSLVGEDVSYATPAFGVALMTAREIEGDTIKWMQQ